MSKMISPAFRNGNKETRKDMMSTVVITVSTRKIATAKTLELWQTTLKKLNSSLCHQIRLYSKISYYPRCWYWLLLLLG
jgi:hypothetical protein